MKLRVTVKDPDGIGDAIDEAARDRIEAMEGLDDEDREALLDSHKEKVSDALSKWVAYDEYLTIEFDTDAGTATVVSK